MTKYLIPLLLWILVMAHGNPLAPAFSIAWITTGDQVSGEVDLELSVKDFDSQSFTVELSFDNGTTWERHHVSLDENMAAPANWKTIREATWTLHGFDTRAYPNGPLTILVRAQNHAGKVTQAKPIILQVEN